MAKYDVFLSVQAERDLKEIVNYLTFNLQEPKVAKDIVNEIDKSILSLEEMPYKYSLIKDSVMKEAAIRKIIVRKYIIFYKIDETNKRVGIVRVMYGRRDWQKLI